MKIKLILGLCLLPFFGLAQESKLGNWLIYFGNKKLNDKWNWHHEAQYRNYNAIGDMEQLLLRTGLGYNLTPQNNNVLFGYGFIQSENYIDQNQKEGLSEHRVYQQFITKQKAGRVSLQHRYRFEQRFFEDVPVRLRLRYFLSLNIPLNNQKLTDKTFYTSAYNEIFIHGQGVLFDRNRAYAGIGYKLDERLRFELGYMKQRFVKSSRDQVNIITFFNF